MQRFTSTQSTNNNQQIKNWPRIIHPRAHKINNSRKERITCKNLNCSQLTTALTECFYTKYSVGVVDMISDHEGGDQKKKTS